MSISDPGENVTSPMPVAWGNAGGTNAVGDAALNLTLTNLNLADWKAFTGQPDAAGLASATLKIRSQQAGQQLGFNLAAQLDNLSLKLASNSSPPWPTIRRSAKVCNFS